MRPVIDEVLHDDGACLGQRDDQRVVRLGAAQAAMLDARAVNDLVAFVDAPIGLARLGRNIVSNFFVFLARHAVAGRADLRGHACEREEWSLKCRRPQQMIGMVVRDIEPRTGFFSSNA